MGYRLGIVGCGTMASAVLESALKQNVVQPSEVIVSALSLAEVEKWRVRGVAVTTDNGSVAEQSEYVLFAVKPQQFLQAVKPCANCKKVISIMAGVRKEKIRAALSPAAKVARCMPNLPCVIGAGVTGADLSEFDCAEQEFLQNLLSGMGKVVLLSEEKLDAVTGISGSGPAYVYLFLQSLIAAGMQQGLSEEEARTLAFQTVKGGAEMAERSEKPLSDLIASVCSKGGTTIEAMNSFARDDFAGAVERAVAACVKRSKELSE